MWVLASTVSAKSESSNQITGGDQVTISGKYPFQVGLYMKGEALFCGGSIIDKNWVVTAAHCLDDDFRRRLSQVRILAGIHDVNDVQGKQIRGVKKFKIHTFRQQNDIALLELDSPLTLGRTVSKILLDANDLIPGGTISYSIGWGARFEADRFDIKVLKELRMKVGSNNVCTKELHKYNDIPRRKTARDVDLLCAEGLDGTRSGTCNGDSGGPLFYIDSSLRYKLIGITSFSLRKCEAPNSWDFFMNVNAFIPWISQSTGLSVSSLTGSVKSALVFQKHQNNIMNTNDDHDNINDNNQKKEKNLWWKKNNNKNQNNNKKKQNNKNKKQNNKNKKN